MAVFSISCEQNCDLPLEGIPVIVVNIPVDKVNNLSNDSKPVEIPLNCPPSYNSVSLSL